MNNPNRINAPWMATHKQCMEKNWLISMNISISVPIVTDIEDEHYDNSDEIYQQARDKAKLIVFNDIYKLKEHGYDINDLNIIIDPDQPEKPVYEHTLEPSRQPQQQYGDEEQDDIITEDVFIDDIIFGEMEEDVVDEDTLDNAEEYLTEEYISSHDEEEN